MSSWIEYKGYSSKVEYSAEDDILYGRIEGIADLVTFEAESAAEVVQAFHEAVDDYLVFCKSVGKSPDKTYKGTFNVRIPAQHHKELSEYAMRLDCSLNDAVCQAVDNFLHPLNATMFAISQNEQVINQQLKEYWGSNKSNNNNIVPISYRSERMMAK